MTSEEIKALWNRAILLHGQSRFAEALECMAALEPSLPDDPRLLSNLGVVCRDTGDLVRAEHYLRRACALRPDDPAIHYNLALALLRAGRLSEGFDEYEWRWQVSRFRQQRRQFTQPLWRGEPLQGRRILIYGEQGAGDTIQFARYAPLVREAGGDVTLEVLPHLERLASWMPGGYRIVGPFAAGLEFDVQCPLMSLPHRFATEVDSIPAPARFSIPTDVQAEWARRVRTGRTAIGVVWSGNPAYADNRARSLPAGLLLPLTSLSAIDWWSLQVGAATADIPAGLVSLADHLIDFAETAAAISQLDLIVTVDTAVAHLAGSLGKPVWLLLAYSADWRWLLHRADTPWYPSVRIFRQQRPGDWDEVIERVAAEL